MKFGKEFKTHLEETLPEWRDKFLCYKPLKKLLKQLPPTVDSLNLDHPIIFQLRQRPPPLNDVDDDANTNRPLVDLQEWFVGILNEELDKFNDFYVDKEEDFVIRLQELKERIESLKEKSSKDGVLTSESEFSEEMMDIRKDSVTIHGEMVLLKNYSSLNFAGLVKILKKYDKRTGGLLRLPFTQLALHQPFFTTEPLTRLVRECEDNLELLFPLEAEVIESTNVVHDQSNPSPSQIVNTSPDQSDPSPSQTVNTSPEPSSTLGEETVDIYRSTLAAMKAIRGLHKASSTCNPLSFSSFFKGQEDETTGAVTNSTSNSSATIQDGEEIDQKVVNSV